MKTLTIILTDGPYISEYADMAYKIASEALKVSQVNIFLYLDAVHIAKVGQKPSLFGNAGKLFSELAERGAKIRPAPGVLQPEAIRQRRMAAALIITRG